MQEEEQEMWTVLEAVATALLALEGVPEDRQPKRSMARMRRILARSHPTTVALILAQVKCRLRPELDPADVFREYGVDGLERAWKPSKTMIAKVKDEGKR